MKTKKNYILFILLNCLFQFNAQNYAQDSIAKMLESNVHDTIKCNSLMNYIESGLEETVWPIYNDKLILLSKNAAQKSSGLLKQNYLSYYSLSISNKGFQYVNLGEFTLAKKYFSLALDIQKTNNLTSGIGSTYINLGFVNHKEGNTPMALNYYHSALKIFLEQKDINQAAVAYNNLAYIFSAENENKQALIYYQKALAMHLQTKDLRGAATVINNLSQIYSMIGDPLCKDSKKESLKCGIKKGFLLLERAIKIEDSLNDKIELAGSLNVLAGFYEKFGDPSCSGKKDCIQSSKKKALELYKRSLALRIETNHITGLVLSYHSLAKHLFLANKLDEAEIYGNKCYALAKKIGTPEFIKDAAKILSEIYKKQKKYTEALIMYELFIHKQDSLINNSTKRAAIQKGFQLEYEKKAEADSIKVVEEKKVTALQFRQEENQRYFLYASIGITSLFALFMFNRFRITQKQKKIITVQKELVDTQKKLVDEKQKELLDSIHYAKRIQISMLPTETYFKKHIRNT